MADATPNAAGEPAAIVDQWVAQAKAKADRYRSMQAAVGGVSVTESSKDGMVSVTVDSAGNVSDLRLTDKVRQLSGAQVASAVLLTLRRAQARLPERLGEVMAATIGEDQQTVETIVGNYRAKFPEPEEPQEQAASDGVRRIGTLPQEASAPPPSRPASPPQPTPPPPPPPAAPAPARPRRDDGDDEGWGDRTFMVRE